MKIPIVNRDLIFGTSENESSKPEAVFMVDFLCQGIHFFLMLSFIIWTDVVDSVLLYKPTSSKEHKVTELNLLQEGKLSLHSLTGYPTCEHARVYSTKARQNVSSSSELGKKDGFFFVIFFYNNNNEKKEPNDHCVLLQLTCRGQICSWLRKDLGRCFRGTTRMGKREARYISLWHPAHKYNIVVTYVHMTLYKNKSRANQTKSDK